MFAILGNAFTLLAIVNYPALRTPSNVFIFNLALNDLTTGLLTPLAVITNYAKPEYTQFSGNDTQDIHWIGIPVRFSHHKRSTEIHMFSNISRDANKDKRNGVTISNPASFQITQNQFNTSHFNSTTKNNLSIFKGTNQLLENITFHNQRNVSYNVKKFKLWSRLCQSKELLGMLVPTCGSMFSILIISVDRYIFIQRPLQYYNIVTIKRAIIVCIFLWMCMVALGPGTLYFYLRIEIWFSCDSSMWDFWYFYAYITPFFIIITGTNIILYGQIASVAFGKSKVVQPVTGENGISAMNRKMGNENKVTKMLAIVLGLYFLFYFPSVIFGSFSQESHITLVVLKYISYLLWYMSMCVNPWIYVWKSKDFRRAFVKLLYLKHVEMVDPNGVSSY